VVRLITQNPEDPNLFPCHWLL